MDIPHEVAKSGSRYFDSPEYLELFYPFEPNDIWRMAVTKSERKRVILNRVYDRMEIYLARMVEYYRKTPPSSENPQIAKLYLMRIYENY